MTYGIDIYAEAFMEALSHRGLAILEEALSDKNCRNMLESRIREGFASYSQAVESSPEDPKLLDNPMFFMRNRIHEYVSSIPGLDPVAPGSESLLPELETEEFFKCWVQDTFVDAV